MKQILFILLSAVFLAGCEKHELNKAAYAGKWYIKSVQFKTGNPFSPQPEFMQGGMLTLKTDNTLEFLNCNGEIFTGTWEMWDTEETDKCNTDADGNMDCTYKWVTYLKLHASNANGTVKKSQFDDVKLMDENNRFTCRYRPNIATEYEYTFTRQ